MSEAARTLMVALSPTRRLDVVLGLGQRLRVIELDPELRRLHLVEGRLIVLPLVVEVDLAVLRRIGGVLVPMLAHTHGLPDRPPEPAGAQYLDVDVKLSSC